MARILDDEAKVSTDENGVERLAEDKVMGQVVGSKVAGSIRLPNESRKAAEDAGPVTKKNRVGYVVIHEHDAAQFVRNTATLSKISNDPEIRPLMEAKGFFGPPN